MNDDVTIIPPAPVSDNNSSITPITSNTTQHEMEIITVNEVTAGNRRQAEATLRALAEAGLDLELAAKGLEEGHGNTVNKMITNQRFIDMENKVGGMAVSQNSVAAWQLEAKKVLGSGNVQSENTGNPGLLIYQGVGTEIEKMEDLREEIGSRRIKMVVVMGTKVAGEIEASKEDPSLPSASSSGKILSYGD
ncbi:MAG: hypothetical protein Q7S44_04445 [bacterium]|nr:hypothetical protein [bacterium]